MKLCLKHLAMGFVAALSAVCTGGEPLRWTRTPANASPAAFTTYHGQSLELECAFRGFGALPFEGEDVHLYWQTNGMGEAWWSMPATVASNTVSATFSPVNDTGADRVTFFFGVPGNAYAAAIVRFLPSPDFAPSTTPPPPVLADAVLNIVTNEVVVEFEWRWLCEVPEIRAAFEAADPYTVKESDPNAFILGGNPINIGEYREYDPYSTWYDDWENPTEIRFEKAYFSEAYGYVRIDLVRRVKTTCNALGLAMLKDLEGKADASVTNDIAKVKAESALIYRLFSGSNIVVEVTNYNSKANAPAMRMMRLENDGSYVTVWAETNGLERTYQRAASNTADQVAALERKTAKTYAPRGWAATTSGLGADAPKNTTWISTPTTVIAGGMEYEKHVTASGQLWFLKSNGMVATLGANSGGYLNIAAADGTSVFSIEKTDSQLVPVDTDGISVNGDTVTVKVSVVSDSHPFLRYAPTLQGEVAWEKEEDGFTSPIEVAWSGSSGAWVATVTATAKEGYFHFEFFQEGGTKIKNGGVLDVSTGGILCTDGIHKCRPVYNSDGTVTLEVF